MSGRRGEVYKGLPGTVVEDGAGKVTDVAGKDAGVTKLKNGWFVWEEPGRLLCQG